MTPISAKNGLNHSISLYNMAHPCATIPPNQDTHWDDRARLCLVGCVRSVLNRNKITRKTRRRLRLQHTAVEPTTINRETNEMWPRVSIPGPHATAWNLTPDGSGI